MVGKGDFGGFEKGFLLDKKKDKSPESSKKPGQLSTGDQQLARMGVDPKKYHEKQEGTLSGHETVLDHSIEYFLSPVFEMLRDVNRELAKQYEQFKAQQAEHLTKSKEEILGTAKEALRRVPEGQRKEALFLGFGNGLDVDLPRCAEMFDRITLVDLDRESPERAIKQLSPDLQQKIKLVIADIAGINGKLVKESVESIQDSNSKDQMSGRLVKIMNNAMQEIAGSTPNLGTDYAFVCSHLVSSQLGTISHIVIRELAKSKFGVEPFIKLDNSVNDLPECHEKLSNNLHEEHIRYLARLVAPLGTVHFADTYIRQMLDSGAGTIMVNPEIINPVLQKKFKSIKGETSWLFRQHPTQQFLVVSHSLERNAIDLRRKI